MKRTRWRLFSYLFIHKAAAQEDLNQMAAQGWELTRIYLGLFAKFRRTECTDLTYFLDWDFTGWGQDETYVQLCRDAGWELVDDLGYLNLYASQPGVSPTPIQTDWSLEFQRLKRKCLRMMAVGLALSIPFLLPLPYIFSAIKQRLLFIGTSYTITLMAALIPLWLVGGLVYFLLLARQLWQWRQALRREEVPANLDSRRAKAWGCLPLLVLLSSGILSCALLMDGLVSNWLNWGVALGIILCGVLVMLTTPKKQKAFSIGISNCVFGLALSATLLLHPAYLDVFPGRLPQSHLAFSPSQATESLDICHNGPLASRSDWSLRPLTADYFCYVQVQAETWLSPALAQYSFPAVSPDFEPVPGQDGLWQAAGERGGTYLVQTDRTRVELSYYGADSQPVAQAAALAWLDNFEGRVPT